MADVLSEIRHRARGWPEQPGNHPGAYAPPLLEKEGKRLNTYPCKLPRDKELRRVRIELTDGTARRIAR